MNATQRPFLHIDSHITRHAIERYRERVAGLHAQDSAALPDRVIVQRLDCPALHCAIHFGARAVKMASGHRMVIEDDKVVTITPSGGDFI